MKTKLFSDTLKVLLNYSRTNKETITFESLREVLKDIYHPEMTINDMLIVINRAFNEACNIPEFNLGDMSENYLKIIQASYRGAAKLGSPILGPNKYDKFTVSEFYNSIIAEYIHIFMFCDKGWCIEYLTTEHDLECISEGTEEHSGDYYDVYKCKKMRACYR